MAGEEEECNCPPEGAPAWMATFGDLMSLLVTFFVLLLSFANMDIVKFKQMAASMKDAFGLQLDQPGEFAARSNLPIELSDSQSTPFINIMKIDSSRQRPTMDQQMMAQIQELISSQGLHKIVEATSDARGVVVKVKGHMLFEGGSDILHPEAFIFLDEIAKLAKSFPYAMVVEGHSDDQAPGKNSGYSSNWHLSAARAITALRYLVDAGGVDRRRLSAAGYSDTKPLFPNDSAEHRAANRRVEFVYLRDRRLAVAPKKKSPDDDWRPEALQEGSVDLP